MARFLYLAFLVLRMRESFGRSGYFAMDCAPAAIASTMLW
jgi:hypothetical protein